MKPGSRQIQREKTNHARFPALTTGSPCGCFLVPPGRLFPLVLSFRDFGNLRAAPPAPATRAASLPAAPRINAGRRVPPLRRVGSGRRAGRRGVGSGRFFGLVSLVWSLGGVPWLFRSLAVSVSCPSLRSCCVRLAVGWPRGAVSPWGCRSAAPGCRCRGLSLSPGSARSRRRLASRCRGVAACRFVRAFARCVGSRVVSRCRCRCARACRRAAPGWPPWWRLAPPLLPRRSPWPLRVAALSLAVFAAGLAPGCVLWSPWPRRPGVLLMACPSRLAAGYCRRRAGLFGLAAAGPVAVSRRRWLVAVRWVARPPSALAVRLGAGPVARSSLPLPGVPLPVPPRGGFSHSPTRSAPAVSLRQGWLF